MNQLALSQRWLYLNAGSISTIAEADRGLANKTYETQQPQWLCWVLFLYPTSSYPLTQDGWCRLG